MMRTAHLVYFSPTGTTRKVAEGIAQGLGADKVVHYDLTPADARFETVLTDGVAIIGIPVYAGRVPELCLQRLQAITARHMPAVLVALYGNREFEDALVELRDLSVAKGFNVIGAGAFIGEHSFSTPAHPIAAGRPDAEDLKLALQFGKQVAAKIEAGDFNTPDIDGNVPYRERPDFGGMAPETDSEQCTLCGKCAAVCPAGVIAVGDSVATNAENCIMCCACVKACEVKARSFTHPWIEEKRPMLQKNCSTPKEPQIHI
jgi:flavodoxin/NAD-dependent dihydropyrimidine dehydrogenase PreA subunit